MCCAWAHQVGLGGKGLGGFRLLVFGMQAWSDVGPGVVFGLF